LRLLAISAGDALHTPVGVGVRLVLVFSSLRAVGNFPILFALTEMAGQARAHARGQDNRWVSSMAKPKRGRSTAAIDDHVGARIRERRIMLGLTQQQLAEMIGVTYQQAHKYERGINRVSAGRLFEIARVLNAPITYFYEGLGEDKPRTVTPHQRMLLEIARNFAEIQNEKHQEAVSQLARALAGR
jgi:transcriptional regulator with XRE-family HTH domain